MGSAMTLNRRLILGYRSRVQSCKWWEVTHRKKLSFSGSLFISDSFFGEGEGSGDPGTLSWYVRPVGREGQTGCSRPRVVVSRSGRVNGRVRRRLPGPEFRRLSQTSSSTVGVVIML